MFAVSEQKCFRVLPFLLALLALSSTIARATTTHNSSSFRIPAKDANLTATSPVTVAKRNQATIRNIITAKPPEGGMSFLERMAILVTVLGIVALLFLAVWIIHLLRRHSKLQQTIMPVDDADKEEKQDDDSNSNNSKYQDAPPAKSVSLKQFESRELEFEGTNYKPPNAKLQKEEPAYDTKHDERSEMAPDDGQHSTAINADARNKTAVIVPTNEIPEHAAHSAPFSCREDSSKVAEKQASPDRDDIQPASGGSPNDSDRKTTESYRGRTESGDGHAKNKKRRRKKPPGFGQKPRTERRGSAKIQPLPET